MSRRRWVYLKNEAGQVEAVEVGDDWRNPGRESTGDLGKFEYDNLRATDGTDISSRTKRREYMKAHGVADPRDFRETTAKAFAKQEEWRAGRADAREVAQQVGRAAYQLKTRRR